MDIPFDLMIELRDYIRPIEVTGLSLEQFYKLLTQDDEPACFEAPRDIWP